MYRKRFMTTIKNVTEQKKKNSLIGFLSSNKINNYNREGEKGKKKKENPKEPTEEVKK